MTPDASSVIATASTRGPMCSAPSSPRSSSPSSRPPRTPRGSCVSGCDLLSPPRVRNASLVAPPAGPQGKPRPTPPRKVVKSQPYEHHNGVETRKAIGTSVAYDILKQCIKNRRGPARSPPLRPEQARRGGASARRRGAVRRADPGARPRGPRPPRARRVFGVLQKRELRLRIRRWVGKSRNKRNKA